MSANANCARGAAQGTAARCHKQIYIYIRIAIRLLHAPHAEDYDDDDDDGDDDECQTPRTRGYSPDVCMRA